MDSRKPSAPHSSDRSGLAGFVEALLNSFFVVPRSVLHFLYLRYRRRWMDVVFKYGSDHFELDDRSVSLYPFSDTAMFFRLTPTTGQPLYLQLMQQVRHAAESGALKDGDQLPGIRTLAEELLVSPNTVVKAYSELEHEGLLELRQGSGAFLTIKRSARSRIDDVHAARRRVAELIRNLREEGLREDEIRRVFEAELLHATEVVRR